MPRALFSSAPHRQLADFLSWNISSREQTLSVQYSLRQGWISMELFCLSKDLVKLRSVGCSSSKAGLDMACEGTHDGMTNYANRGGGKDCLVLRSQPVAMRCSTKRIIMLHVDLVLYGLYARECRNCRGAIRNVDIH